MAISTPVLDLTIVNPEVSIDGERYALRVREDLSILTNAEHAKRFDRIDQLRGNGKRSPKEKAELGKLLEEACAAVLDAPPAILGKLTEYQRLSVVTAFFRQVAGANPATPAARKLATSKR